MTEDRISGAARSGFGKVENKVGGAVGSDDLEAKGQVNEVIGNVQDMYGRAVDSVRDATDNLDQLVSDEPYKALGIAVAAGLVVGFLLGRSGRKVVYVRS